MRSYPTFRLYPKTSTISSEGDVLNYIILKRPWIPGNRLKKDKQKPYVLCISEFHLGPSPRATGGHLPALTVPGVGHKQLFAAWGSGIRQPLDHPVTFDTYLVSYRMKLHAQRILQNIQTDWLICQGRENFVEGCKGVFPILFRYSFIARLLSLLIKPELHSSFAHLP